MTERQQFRQDAALSEAEVLALLFADDPETAPPASRQPRPDHCERYATSYRLKQRRRALKRWWETATKHELACHDWRIREVWRLRDAGLSYREIARRIGWKSPGSVAYHLNKPRPAEQPLMDFAVMVEPMTRWRC